MGLSFNERYVSSLLATLLSCDQHCDRWSLVGSRYSSRARFDDDDDDAHTLTPPHMLEHQCPSRPLTAIVCPNDGNVKLFSDSIVGGSSNSRVGGSSCSIVGGSSNSVVVVSSNSRAGGSLDSTVGGSSSSRVGGSSDSRLDESFNSKRCLILDTSGSCPHSA